jgi:hypothetical protein
MTTVDINHQRTKIVRSRQVSASWSLGAAGLLLAAAVLQLAASLERWVAITNSWARTDHLVEDHRFDYLYPSDPWENLGTTAQLSGAGFLLLALAVLVMCRGAVRHPRRIDRAIAAVVAGLFALDGLHGIISGATGTPTPVKYVVDLLALVSFIGLVVLAVRWFRSSWPSALACVLLMAITLPGYIVVAFVIAPGITNYQSFDTTPWTETIVAAFVALAAVAMLDAASAATLPRRRFSN